MPKKKTKKGAAKRVKVTGTGKFARKKSGAGHLLRKKKSKRKRKLRKDALVSKSFEKEMKNLLTN